MHPDSTTKRARVLDSDRLTTNGKLCSKCGEDKPLNEFYRVKLSTTGYSSYCKECFKAQVARRNKTPERYAYEAEYRAVHKEQMRRKNRDWYERNQEKAKADTAARRATDPEKIKAEKRAYAQRHPEQVAHGKRQYRARRHGAPGKYTRHEWEMLCTWFGNCCLCCGDTGKLTADHVLPIILGGSNNIDNIQPLCGRCNSAKRDKHIDYRDPAMLSAFLISLGQ